MSRLGQAVVERLRLPEDKLAEVEGVLASHQVSMSASQPTPSRLHFTSLEFNGTKLLTGVTSDGVRVATDHVEEVPFTFHWDLGTGLYGVGSDENLRGKSSTLRILMWALRGRCDLKNEVRAWIDHVEVGLSIDGVEHRVVFDVDHAHGHRPVGTLTRTTSAGVTVVGMFETDDMFEDVMGSAMMSALRLPPIASTQEGKRTQHVWPTYAGAFLIRGDTLDNLLGEHKFGGLPSRLLSMFVGAEWAASRAEATSATTVAKAELTALEDAADKHVSALAEAHQQAQQAVDAAQGQLAQLSDSGYDLDAVTSAFDTLAELDARAAELNHQLLSARATFDRAARQLSDEQARRVQQLENARAVYFFQQLQPHVCPRCAAPVTKERREAEVSEHECSVCTTTLDLTAQAADVVVATTVPDPERQQLVTDAHIETGEAEAASGDGHIEEDAELEAPVDDVTALAAAGEEAESRVLALESELAGVDQRRADALAVIEASRAATQVAAARHQAEVDLARAQGAAAALAPDTERTGPDQTRIAELTADLKILEAAVKVTTGWVQDGQRQWLADLNDDITRLAREFGIPNLTAVELQGNGGLRVHQGGQESPFGSCERGEKLRLKLATAIALIKQGRSSGVGRHPGVLFVDSPGAEEVPIDDLDTMLEALQREATAADIQVFVGTRHTDELVSLLGADRCRLGRGSHYVW